VCGLIAVCRLSLVEVEAQNDYGVNSKKKKYGIVVIRKYKKVEFKCNAYFELTVTDQNE